MQALQYILLVVQTLKLYMSTLIILFQRQVLLVQCYYLRRQKLLFYCDMLFLMPLHYQKKKKRKKKRFTLAFQKRYNKSLKHQHRSIWAIPTFYKFGKVCSIASCVLRNHDLSNIQGTRVYDDSQGDHPTNHIIPPRLILLHYWSHE